VGASAQTKAMKKVAGRLRLELAQYRELEAFSQFGSELDPATQKTLARGERMVATLNQPQYKPWPHAEQVVALYAGVNGFLDEIPAPQVSRFQDELREHLRAEKTVYASIDETNDLTDETTQKLDEELKGFLKRFNVEEDTGLVA
jgi:F-type H+-transporting ATPase subunit alpha